jgi:hypothetical protein
MPSSRSTAVAPALAMALALASGVNMNGEAVDAAAVALSPSRVINTLLSLTCISKGTSLTRLSTTRVLPLASTAVMLRAAPISMFSVFLFKALAVSGKSRAMRAGLSMVKLLGLATGFSSTNSICTRFPPSEEKCISFKVLAVSSAALAPVAKHSTAIDNTSVITPCRLTRCRAIFDG